MAAPILSSEPSTVVAGDTLQWMRTFADYPAPTWTLTYALRYQNGSGLLNVTATASGSDHAVVVLAVDSAKMKSGAWMWAAYVTAGAERHQVGTGTLQVFANLAMLDSACDLRSPAKRAYDNALVAWESVKLGQTMILNGRTYAQHNLKDLILYVDRCKADYANELLAENIARTGINPRKIGVRNVRL